MNIHPDCQDPSLKCQPKSRLLRRQKSASEIEARYFGGGDQVENDSKLNISLITINNKKQSH
jgi:hypothetical protein